MARAIRQAHYKLHERRLVSNYSNLQEFNILEGLNKQTLRKVNRKTDREK